MLFKQQLTLAALGQSSGGGQAADAGSDHDRVPHTTSISHHAQFRGSGAGGT